MCTHPCQTRYAKGLFVDKGEYRIVGRTGSVFSHAQGPLVWVPGNTSTTTIHPLSPGQPRKKALMKKRRSWLDSLLRSKGIDKKIVSVRPARQTGRQTEMDRDRQTQIERERGGGGG